MKKYGRALALVLVLLVLFQTTKPVNGCGPEFLQPIFVFRESPDLPFAGYTAGKIGILQPTFGNKTLVIAYRYVNGGSFSADEQRELVSALKGAPPEKADDKAIQDWIALRQ